MPASSAPSVAPASAVTQANEAIRRYVVGRTSWSPPELAELARLRSAWLEAVRRGTREYVTAA